MNPASIEMGRAKIGTSAERTCSRKTTITTLTVSISSISVSRRVAIDWWISSERS